MENIILRLYYTIANWILGLLNPDFDDASLKLMGCYSKIEFLRVDSYKDYYFLFYIAKSIVLLLLFTSNFILQRYIIIFNAAQCFRHNFLKLSRINDNQQVVNLALLHDFS